ncbi:hypothetical protein TSUD_76770 [Trifolium subterraneum]|uniref:Uncharacterized protein n=1 Tax=Trifolium subterraneum TaxID=3900 RepID=A0A2Z6MBB3_TRISU|nr:hypothetical protein TSUD_76770 [Trifolium subterraneum]
MLQSNSLPLLEPSELVNPSRFINSKLRPPPPHSTASLLLASSVSALLVWALSPVHLNCTIHAL